MVIQSNKGIKIVIATGRRPNCLWLFGQADAMRLVELARVTDAQRNLVGIVQDEAIQIKEYSYFALGSPRPQGGLVMTIDHNCALL